MRIRYYISCLLLTCCAIAWAQQPQTQVAPISPTNAKYVNGVAPGYWVTAGNYLTLNVGSGTSFCGGIVHTYAGSTLTMTASTTNYVYLNTANSCTPSVKTTAFTYSDVPVAIVITNAANITNISDVRTMFNGAPAGTATVPTVNIGTVTTGSTPSVYNSGTEYAAILNFILPGGQLGQPMSFTGATDPPGQACTASPAINLGTYATSTTDKMYQCLAGTWTLVGGGGVTHIVAGTNVTVSPSGGVGAVTVNAANLGMLNGAIVAFAGDSSLGDDIHALGNTITVTAINCNGTVCIATNSGSNGLVAGGWVDIQGVTSPSFLNVGNTITTGQSLFQILPTGLTNTQFEWAYTANTGTGTGGVAYDASYDLPFQILEKNSFAGYAKVYVHAGGAASIYYLSTGGYTTYFHPQSPAVKGGTGYLFMMQDEDVYFTANNPTCTAAAIEGYYQTVWTAAHADGWKIVQESTKPSTQMFNSIGNCSATPAIAVALWQTMNAWMQAQGVSNLNVASGAYWDNWVDMAPAFNSDDDGILATSGRFTAAGIARNAALTNETIATGGSQILPTAPCEPWSDCAQLDGTNSFTYTNTFQKGIVADGGGIGGGVLYPGLEFDGVTNRAVFGYQYPNQSPALFLQYNGDGGNFFPAEQWTEKGNATSTGYYLESLQNNGEYGFGPTGSEDTCISRASAGVVAIGVCGAPGDATGTINAASFNSTGPVSMPSLTLNTTPLALGSGGTGSPTAAGALTNLGAAPLAGAAFTGPVSVASTFAAQDITSIGPLFDVTQFGAVADGSTDSTAAIQAAFNACAAYNTSTGVLGLPPGGIVEFPGGGDVGGFYVISGTINAYDGCILEGGGSDASKPTAIQWNGPATGATYSTTAFTAAVNGVYPSTTYTAAFPQITGSTQNRAAQNVVTFTGTNSLSANQWVSISGCTTTAGLTMNNDIGQVASATGTSAIVAVPSYVTSGAFSDTCTLTAISVMVAFDGAARFNQIIKSLTLRQGTHNPSVVVLYGDRVDAGTFVWDVWAQGASMYGFYYSQGGINIDIDKGWRCDGDVITCVYWKIGSSDNFGIANGTEANASTGSSSGGLAILDNNACASGNVRLTIRNVKVEVNTTLAPGMGVITMYDCPSEPDHQFLIDTQNYWVTDSSAISNFTSFAMIPANDYALMLSTVNGLFQNGTGSNTTQRFVGLPALTRADIGGPSGIIPFLSYSISANSAGLGSGRDTATTQFIGDVNVSQLWQDGIKASAFLYSDPAFAALPNGTTLYAGQILAPPSYWSGANGKRYALDVVYQSGTTGTPNGGNTTCSTPDVTITNVSVTSNVATFTYVTNGSYPSLLSPGIEGQPVTITDSVLGLSNSRSNGPIINAAGTQFTIAYTHANVSSTSDTGTAKQATQLVCSSATDLSPGQLFTIGTDSQTIYYVSSTSTSTPIINATINLSGIYVNQALTFTSPVLGPEMQMPTKSAAAPTTLAWSQGDMEQNSGATANGVAAWVNVAGGTPGTWAGVPLGNSSGQIATSQIAPTSLQGTDTNLLTSGTVSGTGSSLCTDANGGATTIGCSSGSSGVNSYNGGDVLCAHGADTTILSNAITAGTATSLTVATLPSYMKIPGTVIGVTGATPSGLNGTYAVTSSTSNTMNFASLGATWSSGGTVYLACMNSTDDITPSQWFTNNTYAASLSVGQTLTQKTQYAYWTTATAPTWQIYYKIGSLTLGEYTAETLRTSATGFGGVLQLGLSSPATGWVDASKDFALFGAASASDYFGVGNELNNVSSGTLEAGGIFTATGLGSITSYTSGATVTGAVGTTCTLGTFNNSLTGGAVTATLVTLNTLAGATFVVTNTGYGATAAPTTATVSSGTATCSGTATLVTVLGGAQGNAVMLRSMKTTQ